MQSAIRLSGAVVKYLPSPAPKMDLRLTLPNLAMRANGSLCPTLGRLHFMFFFSR
jgi:hypothetical protein